MVPARRRLQLGVFSNCSLHVRAFQCDGGGTSLQLLSHVALCCSERFISSVSCVAGPWVAGS